jgi:nucleosome binding factor SPN SPT16 subunit
MRKALNLKFKEFVVKVEEVAKRHDFKLEFEMPYRDLSFRGTPFREMVTLLPSVNCLVNLTETPAFVLSMREVRRLFFSSSPL